MLHQASQPAGYDHVNQLVEGVTKGDRSVVAEKFEASLQSNMTLALRSVG